MTRLNPNLPFRRVYFDVPPAVYEMMEAKAKSKNMFRKDYLAALVAADVKRKK